MYKVLFDEYKDDDIAKIQFTEGRFNGIIFQFNTIAFKEENEDGVLDIMYDIIETPSDFDVNLLTEDDKAEFEKLIGDVLISILEDALGDADEHDEEIGTNNLIKSNIQ
jgi:hypothetical protein